MRIQIKLDGFMILPKAAEGDFERLPMDGWYGGDHWNGFKWIPQEKNPRPQIVWPMDYPFWIVLDDNVIVSTTPLYSPLPNISCISREEWNQEWQFCVPDDLNKMTLFRI